MEVFLAGTDVSLRVALQDRSGNAIDVGSISYRVVDQDATEKVASTPLVGFVASSTFATVLIPALANEIAAIPADSAITMNQIDTFNTREVRSVELTCLLASGNTIVLKASYGLELSDPLRVGINSFQTMSQAELTALDIPGIPGWQVASEEERITALIAARSHICQLNFYLLNSNVNWGQDNLNFVPEGTQISAYAGGNRSFIFNGNLALLTPLQFSRLPARFRTALRNAQIAEADQILGGDPVDAKRREGIMLDSIGESKMMFRAGKPIDLPVSKRALRYLSAFVTFTKRIGRG